MAVNLDKPKLWKADIARSVDMYNDWFIKFAPKAFRDTRVQTTKAVEETLQATSNLTNIKPAILRDHPEVLPTLRMSTCPPLAVDRLIGLAGVPRILVHRMEIKKKLPVQLKGRALDAELRKIGSIIERMADPDIFVWLKRNEPATEAEIHRAATIVADRLCGSVANPIIRNAQEKRQLAAVKSWLENRRYRQLIVGDGTRFNAMLPGTFSFRMNVAGHAVRRHANQNSYRCGDYAEAGQGGRSSDLFRGQVSRRLHQRQQETKRRSSQDVSVETDLRQASSI
jgi:hypothetical protein